MKRDAYYIRRIICKSKGISMPYGKMLKQSFQIVWNYKVLWIFATILALMGGRGCTMGSTSIDLPYTPTVPSIHIGFEILFTVAILLLIVLGVVWRYISETSIIKMSDHYFLTGEKLSFKEGVKLGKSKSAGTIFKLDFTLFALLSIIYIPVSILFILPLVKSTMNGNEIGALIGGVIGTVLLFFLIFATVLFLLALLPVFYIAHRVIIFENLSMGKAIKRSWSIVKDNFQDLFVSIVIQAGIGMGLCIVPSIALIFTVLIGVSLSGAAVAITDLIFNGPLDSLGDILGYVLFGLIIICITLLPFSFIRGWLEIFYSSYWTLFYREILEKEKRIKSSGGEEVSEERVATQQLN